MGLFAKNKPTKRIYLSEDKSDWVELQYLSKGIKDELKSEAMSILKGFEIDTTNGQPKDGLKVSGEFIKKTQEVEYRQMVAAISEWSAEEEEITIENVKALSGDVYDKISDEIFKMNEMNEEEIKN